MFDPCRGSEFSCEPAGLLDDHHQPINGYIRRVVNMNGKFSFRAFFVLMDLKIRIIPPHQKPKPSTGVPKFVELFVVVDNTEVQKRHA